MHTVRSLFFGVSFYCITPLLTLLVMPGLLLPYPGVVFLKQVWLYLVLGLVRLTAGLGYETRGTENIPDGPVILAAKHQSAWDTFALGWLHAKATFVLKRELMWIPIYGWYLWRLRMIGIDRSRGLMALRQIAAQARRNFERGLPVLIFPQGTRTPPGEHLPYLPGVAAVYARSNVPVVPVALNSGLFWPRRQFMKWPGVITVAYLEPIPPGLDRKTFMKILEDRIESATTRLEVEARDRFPWLPANKT